MNNKESKIYDAGVVQGIISVLEAILEERHLEFNKENIEALLKKYDLVDYKEELLNTYFYDK